MGANKIVLPADGNINIGAMAENFKAFMPKMGRTKKPVLHISLNPHPDDRLTDQDFEILAREYLDKLYSRATRVREEWAEKLLQFRTWCW